MVVDDDPDILFATARIVEMAGYSVMKASSASDCRVLLRKQRPDLILLDVVLPDTVGPELCREIKADPDFEGIFVILISSMKTSSHQQADGLDVGADGLDVGADGYIARPISNRELKARVDAMVRILVAERERDRLIIELKNALAEVKTLSGLLPLCLHCKKVRDDKGYWNQIEAYIERNSEVDISHSICPECAEKYYPDMDLYRD